jgi:hypothetical protein
MAELGTFSNDGTSTYLSKAFSTIDEVIVKIPDNTGGEIDASDIRDGLYSLWYRVDGLSSSLTGVTISNEFNSSTPSTIVDAIGGILPGSTFSGTIQDLLYKMLYPYVDPSCSISPIGNKEFGSPLNINLNWSVVKGSNTITSIIVDGVTQTVTGNSQSGIQIVSATHSLIPSGPSQTQSFSISVSDGTNTKISTTSLVWLNKIYWGSVNIPSHPNLTTNPGSASLVTSLVTNSVIKGLDGADANGLSYGNELSLTKNKTYLGINGSSNTPGEYLVFAWPSMVSGAYTPIFAVNGLQNTSFTRVRTNSLFDNYYGFTGSTYEVWVSNTRYFSPVNITIS